jgi:hypothetical protein
METRKVEEWKMLISPVIPYGRKDRIIKTKGSMGIKLIKSIPLHLKAQKLLK